MLALLPDVLIEAWKVVVDPTPLQIQMYHERAGHVGACFCGISAADGTCIVCDYMVTEYLLSVSGSQGLVA